MRIIDDPKKIDIHQVSDVRGEDYPDFVDAFIEEADYDGVPMTDDELDYFQDKFPEVLQQWIIENYGR